MSCCQSIQSDAPVNEPPQGTAQRLDEERVRAASRHIDAQRYQTEFTVPDMHCAACIGTIERGLNSMEQVCSVRANLTNRTVAVVWDADVGAGAEITSFLKRLGFEANLQFVGETNRRAIDEKGRRLLKSLAVAGFAAANIMLLSVSVWSGADLETAQLFHLISGLIAVPAVAYAGRPFFESAFKALRAHRLNMDVPISLAVLLALAMSVFESFTNGAEAYFDAAVTLLFFLLIGRYLDHLMRQKARGAVDRLAQLTAKGGICVDDAKNPRFVALSDIRQGMRLRVNPGERLPVDGMIIVGATDIDRSLVTGEAASVACASGEKLEAGVLNLTGSIEITATSDASNSFLAEVTSMMDAAEKGRGLYVGIADRMARLYAPVVHLLALATFIGWMIYSGGDWHHAIYTAIAVLIITCPCALGLAVPVVHVIGAHQLMRRGVMIRDGSAFERLAEINHVSFDKTGTLTLGEPVVVNSPTLDDVSAGLAKALASRTSHPAAQAVAKLYGDVMAAELIDIREIPGMGILAMHGGKQLRLGRPGWVAEIAGATPMTQDESGVAFARQDGSLTRFELEDRLRPDAAATIARLKHLGLEVEIISGDHPTAVAAVAEQVGVAIYSARMTPAEKIHHIEKQQFSGARLLMVGDGINDAPALAAAHASMAPASASDVGRLASDFVFTRPELKAVLIARSMALKTGRLIRQNFALALFYNCLAIPLAVTGHITPLLAAIAMSTSSIVVIANSMRLNLFREPQLQNSDGKPVTVETEQVRPPLAAKPTEVAA
ncbi:MAG: heavy metal translocating P-type ATPase [Rhizobiaceae bacterium]